MTYFQACNILDLPFDFTDQDLRENWLFFIKTYHPDRGGDTEYFKLLIEAYKRLRRQ